MSAQRYTNQPVALARMAAGLCPECGDTSGAHTNDNRFWIPRVCDLTYDGVRDRICQYRADLPAAGEVNPE